MQCRFTHAARRLVLAEWPVRGVQQSQTLGNSFLQILSIDLERHVAPYIDLPQVDGRMAVADPFGDDLADAAGGLQADGIEAGRDEAILELGRFSEVVAHVRCKAFGSAEEFLDAGAFQRRHAPHGIEQHRFEMAEVAGDLAE